MQHSFDSQKVTVVIPAKDEAKSISQVIEGARLYSNRIIVVDGSRDQCTEEQATRLGVEVVRDQGRGKGNAIRVSVPLIDSVVTVFMDGDGSHDAQDIPKLVQPILDGKFDHVSGSRLLGGSSELHGGFSEFMRLSGSSFITACINKRFGVRLSDSQNGFRAIRTDVLRALGLRENSTTIEQEMIIRTLLKGYRMGEIPSHEYPRRFGESKIRLRRVFLRYGYSLLKGLFFTRKGRPR